MAQGFIQRALPNAGSELETPPEFEARVSVGLFLKAPNWHDLDHFRPFPDKESKRGEAPRLLLSV